MTLVYFDTETTGLDPTQDKILTIQYQRLDITKGYPVGPLKILKIWDEGQSEKNIVSAAASLLIESNPWRFVPVGNNLTFDFKFISAKIKQHLGLDVDTLFFLNRPHIDLKHVMILLNGGRFKGYHNILGKHESGDKIPEWYSARDYDKITEYVKNEAKSFTKLYSKLQQSLPTLFYRRLDDYV